MQILESVLDARTLQHLSREEGGNMNQLVQQTRQLSEQSLEHFNRLFFNFITISVNVAWCALQLTVYYGGQRTLQNN